MRLHPGCCKTQVELEDSNFGLLMETPQVRRDFDLYPKALQKTFGKTSIAAEKQADHQHAHRQGETYARRRCNFSSEFTT